MTLIADSVTMITNGPSAQTALNAASGSFVVTGGIAGGAPVDYVGMLILYRDSLQTIALLLNNLKAVTDGSDPNLTTINSDLATIGTYTGAQ